MKDHCVAGLVASQKTIEVLYRCLGIRVLAHRTENGFLEHYPVGERPCGCLLLRIDAIADRTTIHKNDWVMTVFPRHCRRQTKYVFGLSGPSYCLKAEGGQMMAFINNEMPIVGHKIGYFAFSHQALNRGYIDYTCWPFLSATDDPDTVRIDIEECAQPRHPLIQQLLPMH